MAKPPVSPVVIDGKPTNYFQILVRSASKYLKEKGIELNFKGYTETIIEYTNLQEHEVDKAWRLSQELNAWAEYFSSLANLVQKLYLDAETEKDEIKSIASFHADEKTVSNGNRLSNKDPQVVAARKKRNALKALYEELDAKVQFLIRAHYHCKTTYETFARTNANPHSSHNRN